MLEAGVHIVLQQPFLLEPGGSRGLQNQVLAEVAGSHHVDDRGVHRAVVDIDRSIDRDVGARVEEQLLEEEGVLPGGTLRLGQSQALQPVGAGQESFDGGRPETDPTQRVPCRPAEPVPTFDRGVPVVDRQDHVPVGPGDLGAEREIGLGMLGETPLQLVIAGLELLVVGVQVGHELRGGELQAGVARAGGGPGARGVVAEREDIRMVPCQLLHGGHGDRVGGAVVDQQHLSAGEVR